MSSAVSITAASTVCCHGPTAKAARQSTRSSSSVLYAENFADPASGAPGRGPPPRGGRSASEGCGSGWSRRVHGYLRTAARTAAVRSSPVPLGPCRSMVVTMRKLCALPSKPSGSPRRSRATRSSTCSPRWPNGGWPRSWASAAASTTSGSQPPSAATVEATAASQATRSAIARATCATCRLCVSRLCTSRPAPAGLTTCVTPASRAKNGEAAIRSRSTRNGLVARPAPDSVTHDRRAARASSSTPRRLSRPSPTARRRGRILAGVTEVLVVGGGPAGRALAAECAARGLTSTLVDPAPHAPWRATYGAWLDELPADLPPPAATARGRVVAVTSHELDRTYAVLDVPALRDHLDTRLAAAGVRTVTGRVVGTVDGGGAVLLADGTCL